MQLIIGTGKLTPAAARELADFYLHENPVSFDSAPSYGTEELLGRIQKKNKSATVNTKFSLHVTEKISGLDVTRQLDKSLSKLPRIGTYFLHSSNPNLISASAWKVLESSVTLGDIQRVGYAGDAHLSEALGEPRFGHFLATLNPLDQGNLSLLEESIKAAKTVSLKRVLGSGVLSKRFRAKIRRVIRPNLLDQSYEFRFRELESFMGRKVEIADFVDFARGCAPGASIVLGFSGLKSFQNAKNSFNRANLSEIDVARLKEFWRYYAQTHTDVPPTLT